MKRTTLTVISVILVLASIFCIYASITGADDIGAVELAKNQQKVDIISAIDLVEDSIDELDALEESRSDDELSFAEGTAAQEVGGKQLSAGQAQYNAGKAKLDAGKKEYAAGEAEYSSAVELYNTKKQEYDHAVETLEEAQNQLAWAKEQRDEGQAQLDAAAPAYNALKTIDSMEPKAAEAVAIAFGYGSAASIISQYEAGQAQLAQANEEIAEAERQIADGQAQLNAAKAQLDNGKAQLDASRSKLDNAKNQIAAGQKDLNNAKAQLDSGKSQLQQKSDAMANALDSLKEFDDARSIVKNGTAILLENSEIAAKVTDKDDYHQVLNAARQYMDEDAERVELELAARQQLCSHLRIAGIFGLLAGLVCFIAAFNPILFMMKVAPAAAGISAAAAAALTVHSYMNGCGSFMYSLPDGSGSGKAQVAAMLALLLVSVICTITAFACLRAFKVGLGLVVPREKVQDDFDDEPFYDDDEDDEDIPPVKKEKKSKSKKEEKKPEPPKKEPAKKDKKDPPKKDSVKKEPVKEEPVKEEPVQEAPAKVEPAKEEKKPEPAKKDKKGKDKKPVKAPEVSEAPLSAEDQAKARKLKQENSQLKADIEQMEFEKARREYEAARKKYEEARRNATK